MLDRPGVLVALLVAASVLLPGVLRAQVLEPRPCEVGEAKEFLSIQAAVDDVTCNPVVIDPGVWKEQVLVTRNLSIVGRTFRSGTTLIKTTLAPPDVMTPPYALLRVEGSSIKLKVKRVVFQGPAPAGADGLIGIRVGKNAKLTSVSGSEFLDNRPQPLDGRPGFVGIHAGAPSDPTERAQKTYAQVTGSRFVGFQNAAFVLEGRGTTGKVISSAIDTGGARTAGQAVPSGIVIMDGAAVNVNDTSVANAAGPGGGGAGISLSNAPGPLTTVIDNTITGSDIGIAVSGVTGATLRRNRLKGNGVGLLLGATAPVHDLDIRNNRADEGGMGVHLLAGTRSDFYKNEFRANTGEGVRLEADTSDNQFRRNRADTNGGFGFVDVSPGPSTANRWRRNYCHGNNGSGAQSSPENLCLLVEE
jgi:parallel beta-helix repeat protein